MLLLIWYAQTKVVDLKMLFNQSLRNCQFSTWWLEAPLWRKPKSSRNRSNLTTVKKSVFIGGRMADVITEKNAVFDTISNDTKFKIVVTSHSAVVSDKNKMASCYMAMTADEHPKCLKLKPWTRNSISMQLVSPTLAQNIPQMKLKPWHNLNVMLGNILLKSCRFLVLPTDNPVEIGQNILRNQAIIKYGEDHVNSRFSFHGKNNTGNELQCKISSRWLLNSKSQEVHVILK